jgi:hypothetical protein
MSERRVYITEAARRLDRKIDTLRKWDNQGLYPEGLRPRRGDRQRRYWTEDQMPGLEEWFARRVPGSAIKGYDPDPERLALHRRRMRRPRGRNREDSPDA